MRLVATVLLWLLTTVALAVAVPTSWAQNNIVDVDGYAALAQEAASDPALQSAMASEITTRAMALIVAKSGRGVSVDSSLLHRAAAEYTTSPSFPPEFAQVNRLAHEAIFTDADEWSGQGDRLWVVDLAPMLSDSAFQQVFARLNVQVPSTAPVSVTVSAPPSLRPGDLRRVAAASPWVSVGSAVLTGIGALLTLAAARSRGKALAGLGVSALLVGAAGWAGIEIARHEVNYALNYTVGDVRQIADVMVGHAVAGLHQWLNMTLAAGGVLVVFGVIVAMLGALRNG